MEGGTLLSRSSIFTARPILSRSLLCPQDPLSRFYDPDGGGGIPLFPHVKTLFEPRSGFEVLQLEHVHEV